MTIVACYECSVPFKRHSGNHLRCQPCREAHGVRMGRANRRVCYAVQTGQLASLKLEVIACVDCGERADRYDHRDYAKPLEVDPVCRACNRKRGPAARAAA